MISGILIFYQQFSTPLKEANKDFAYKDEL